MSKYSPGFPSLSGLPLRSEVNMMRSDARSQTAAKNRKRKRKEQTATSVVARDNGLFHVLYPSDLAMYVL